MKRLLIVILLFIFFAHTTYADVVTVSAPDEISFMDFVEVKIKINDQRIIDNANQISSTCTDFVLINSNADDWGTIPYKGEKEIKLKYATTNFYNRESEPTCHWEIAKLEGSTKDVFVSISKKYFFNSLEAELNSPSGQHVIENYWNQDTVRPAYRLDMEINKFYPDDYNDIDYEDFFVENTRTNLAGDGISGPIAIDKQFITQAKARAGFYKYQSNTIGSANQGVQSHMIAEMIYDNFILYYNFYGWQDLEGDADSQGAKMAAEMATWTGDVSLFVKKTGKSSPVDIRPNSYTLDKYGDATPSIDEEPEEIEEGVCSTDADCKKGRCNACGECTDADLVSPGSVVIDYDIEPKLSEDEIVNFITKKSILRVPIKTEIMDSKGRTISECDMEAPGLTTKPILRAEFIDNKNYAGFTFGGVNDKRERSRDWEIDLSGETTAIFTIAPTDVKKEIDVVNDVTEKIQLTIYEGAPTAIQEVVIITLTAISQKLDFEMSTSQVQDGVIKAIRVTAHEDESNLMYVKAILSGPGELFKVKEKKQGAAKEAAYVGGARTIFFNMKPGEETEFGFNAPKLSNTNFNELLAEAETLDKAYKRALENTAWETTINAASEGVNFGADKLGAHIASKKLVNKQTLKAWSKYFKRNPGAFTPNKAAKLVTSRSTNLKTMNNLVAITKATQAGFVANDALGVKEGTEGAGEFFNKVVLEDPAPKTYSERAAELGVTIIDGTQVAVGVLTLLPSKIPYFGDAGLAFKAKFSLATNLLKENFRYLAANEKMARAKELFVPAYIAVMIEDESGWHSTYITAVKVAYARV